MKKVIQPLGWFLVLTSVVALASGFALSVVTDTVLAASSAEHHPTGGHVALPPTGQQWASDAPLRKGMATIRTQVEQALTASATPMNDAQAGALRQAIEAQVAVIISDCALAPQADAGLHGLLGELLQGAEALTRARERKGGMARIQASLQRYPQLFADAAWPTSAARPAH